VSLVEPAKQKKTSGESWNESQRRRGKWRFGLQKREIGRIGVERKQQKKEEEKKTSFAQKEGHAPRGGEQKFAGECIKGEKVTINGRRGDISFVEGINGGGERDVSVGQKFSRERLST